jgi:hypothetical protein
VPERPIMLPPAHGSTGHEKIAACAVMTLLGSTSVFRGLAAHARAAEPAEHRERFSEADTVRPPGAQMPVPTPGREVTPSLTEPKE